MAFFFSSFSFVRRGLGQDTTEQQAAAALPFCLHQNQKEGRKTREMEKTRSSHGLDVLKKKTTLTQIFLNFVFVFQNFSPTIITTNGIFQNFSEKAAAYRRKLREGSTT